MTRAIGPPMMVRHEATIGLFTSTRIAEIAVRFRPVDAENFRLLVESSRIRLAHAHDLFNGRTGPVGGIQIHRDVL